MFSKMIPTSWFNVSFLLLTLYTALSFSVLVFPFKIDVKLNDDSTITVNWIVDYDLEIVKFGIEINIQKNFEWLAIGFSDHGDYEQSDVCVLHNEKLTDSWIEKNGAIETDLQQDCDLETFQKLPDGRQILVYSRKFETHDSHDIPIEEGTTQFLVAYSNTTRKNIFGHFVKKKITPNRIFKSTTPPPELPTDVRTLEVRVKNVTIPAQETTYWCTVVRLPAHFNQKQHIVKYEAVITAQSQGIVHHMEVFHCEKPATRRGMPMYNGACVAENLPEPIKSCRRVIGAWAMGAEPFSYPEEAGIPIGGPGYYPFVMVEIHFNNPNRKSNIIDNSGMAFQYTSKLRKFDAGVLEVGLEYTNRMAIPPHMSDFPLSGYCMPECTERGLPSAGITLFASQLHSHLTGRKLETLHVRENQHIAIVNHDNHYSPHWQEIRHVNPVHVYPGGLAITDEMCVNYIHYYPKSDLEVCKSAVDSNALQLYFKYMNKLEYQPTDSSADVASNYRVIKWDAGKIEQLRTFYQEAPVAAECRKSDGDLYQVETKTVLTMR